MLNNKQNKIQFSSIEPLRGVGDVKDRFVFKDGKLVNQAHKDDVIALDSDNYINKGYTYA